MAVHRDLMVGEGKMLCSNHKTNKKHNEKPFQGVFRLRKRRGMAADVYYHRVILLVAICVDGFAVLFVARYTHGHGACSVVTRCSADSPALAGRTRYLVFFDGVSRRGSGLYLLSYSRSLFRTTVDGERGRVGRGLDGNRT